MKVLIIGIIVLTIGVGGLATYLIKSFQTPEALQQIEKNVLDPQRYVLVAARPLQVGARLKAEDLSWQLWPKEAINKQYVVHLEDGQASRADQEKLFISAWVRSPVLAGEPIIAAKVFRRDVPGFMAGVLAPGMRAVSVRVTEETSAAGFIYPGDFVDVVLTHNLATQVMDPNTRLDPSTPLDVVATISETVVRNRRVLSVGQQVENFEQKATIGKTVTIEVDPKESEIIAIALSVGKLSLVLRSMAEGEDEDESGDKAPRTFTTDVEASPFLAAQRTARLGGAAEKEKEEAPSGETPAPVPGPSIRIYRGVSRAVEELR